MKQSDTIGKLAAALVAVQAEVQGVAKDSTNPDYRSSYTSLDAIIGKIRPVLAKNGLAVVQGATTPHSDDTGRIAAIAVETMLVHSSGEWLSNTAIMPVVGRMLKGGGRAEVDPQAGGSALTYGRRYGIAALLCLSTEEDDDGNRAKPQSGAKQGGRAANSRSEAAGATTAASRMTPTATAQPFTRDAVLTFGIFKGTAIKDLTPEFLTWAVDGERKANAFGADTRKWQDAFELELAHRSELAGV